MKMDLKMKFKSFFTLKHKANDGFTLVELIVVIAILAILGGVAVPAYSGYVKKAERAADEALLDEINTAFASACMINGESNYFRNDVDASIGADKKFAYVEPFKTEFDGFFEGEAVEFKAFPNVYYNGDLGMFVNLGDSKFFQIFEGLELTAEQEKLMASIFGTLGAEELMEKIDIVTALVVSGGDAFASMLVGPDGSNIDSMAKAMGYTGMTDEKFQSAYNDMLAAKMAEGMTEGEATNYILANYAVLQAAKTTSNSSKSTAEWLTSLQNGDYVEMTKNLMNQNDAGAQQEGMSQAAMMYAMYTAYANGLDEGEEKTKALENVKDIDKFVNAVGNDEGFSEYLQDEDGKATKDLDGYLASLSIIDKSAANNGEAVSDLLLNGYNNSELIAGLDGLMNQ